MHSDLELCADDWEEAVSQSFVPLQVSHLPAGFGGQIARQRLGSEYGVSRVRCDQSTLNRTVNQAAGDTAESVLFVTHLTGEARVMQNGRHSRQKPGQSVLYLTDRPYQLDFPTAIDELVFQVPITALSTRRRRLDELAARSFEPTTPFKLLRTFVLELSKADPGGDSPALGRIAGELLDVALGSLDGVYVPASADAILAGVRQFVRERASDPDLDPPAIAGAFHISLRHLYNLFAETGDSPAELIRRRRIDLAQRMLINEHNRPVATVAYECGFTDPTTFARAFRARTGHTPAAYRKEHRAVIANKANKAVLL